MATIDRTSLLRDSVAAVAEVGRDAVSTVRDSFGSGEAPFQTVGSGSVTNYLTGFTDDALGSKVIRGSSRFGLATAPGGTILPPPRAELDSVSVEEDRNRGILDQFIVRLTVSIPTAELGRADLIRILRSEPSRLDVPRAGFAALMDAPQVPGKGDQLYRSALRAADLGVGNVVADFISDDPGAPQRSVTSPSERESTPPLPPLNTNMIGSAAGLVSIDGLDRSVAENLTFYLNRRSVGALDTPTTVGPNLGNSSGVNVLRGSSVSRPTDIVQKSNAQGFRTVGKISLGTSASRRVGDFTEFEFVDASVVYGSSYLYSVVCEGSNGRLGPRSHVVRTDVVRTVPPARPDVTYGLTGGVPRFRLRCRPGTSHVEVYRSGKAVLDSITLGSDQSLLVEGPSNKVGDYYHVGDLGLGPDGSTALVDKDVLPGARVSYRFYAVDAYGLKSQTPFSCSLVLPGHGDRVPLAIPSLTSEQTNKGRAAVRVSVTVDDPRVVAFTFLRRDVTVGERAVHQANQPELFTLGTKGPKRAGSRVGGFPHDLEWPSIVLASAGTASFVDTSVRIDRVYQYAAQGIDKRGNKTHMVGAKPVGVYSKPTIDPPTDLQAKNVIESGVPTGILLTWRPGTIDFSPNHLLDDQDVLAATSVRSVFQVERRSIGAPFWDAMPVTTESYFMDPASTGDPTSRPPFVVLGSEYEYRVIAMQSGGFVSPRTDSISVVVLPPPGAPPVVYARCSDIAVRPLNVIVSWDQESTFIERWEVQRASTNKIFGSKIASMDSKQARALDYQTVAFISPESSRASGIKTDPVRNLDRNVFVGNRFYIDPGVDPVNSYFYRVRALGKAGLSSEWTYAGITISSHTFDRKFFSVITDDQKVTMATDPTPVSAPLLSTSKALIDTASTFIPTITKTTIRR